MPGVVLSNMITTNHMENLAEIKINYKNKIELETQFLSCSNHILHVQ